MNIDKLIELYEIEKKIHGKNTYRRISKILASAKELHKEHFLKGKTAKKAIAEGRVPSYNQSWRAFKGKNLEKLIIHIIADEVSDLKLELINGNVLNKKTENLSVHLAKVKRNLLIDYGDYGCHLPDVDMVIYNPVDSKVIAVLSSKVTLRERIAQTGYWKLKLQKDKSTKHIKVFFVTPDEDGTLTSRKRPKKGRAIAEIDTDGCYVFSETDIEESETVKTFDKLIDDIKSLIP